ncbi:hypothetical protein BHE74_00007788 [Ensete ventricosum]|nr:hypothetical protein GW17_00024321 [Ensete ventricosum]RWW83698.1 hypothetical protein BHE74_00007788 [Ensete ventricosum]
MAKTTANRGSLLWVEATPVGAVPGEAPLTSMVPQRLCLWARHRGGSAYGHSVRLIGIGITNPSTVAEEEIGNGGKRQGSSDAASASEEEGSNSDGDYMGCRGRWGRAATAMVASGEGRRRAVALA